MPPRSSAPAPTMLGMFAPPRREASSITGANQATQQIYKVILQSAHVTRASILAPDQWRRDVASEIRNLLRTSPRDPRTREVFGLAQLKEQARALTAWFDAGWASPRMLFNLRRTFTDRVVPISILHHALSYQELLQRWFLPLVQGDTFACDSIVCSSNAARTAITFLMASVQERFNREYGSNLSFNGRFDLIPLGVDTELFRPRDKADARRQFDLPQDAFVLLWMGRFSVANKADLHPLIRVFKRLTERHSKQQLVLVLVGEDHTRGGAVTSYLLDYIAELQLGGQVIVNQKLAAGHQYLMYGCADVFVSPVENIQEAFGITPLEAMASGVPQVVSDWDGYRDTVVHGETGFLVPTYWPHDAFDDIDDLALLNIREAIDHFTVAQATVVDPDLLYAYLDKLIANPALVKKMGERSRQRAKACYDWTEVMRQYAGLWRELGERARHVVWVPPREKSYDTPRFFEAFRHYPTRVLSGEEALELTEIGRAVVQGREAIPERVGEFEIHDAKLIEHLLRRFARRGSKGLILDDVATGALARKHSKNLIQRHVFWLLKYGYVRVKPRRST